MSCRIAGVNTCYAARTQILLQQPISVVYCAEPSRPRFSTATLYQPYRHALRRSPRLLVFRDPLHFNSSSPVLRGRYSSGRDAEGLRFSPDDIGELFLVHRGATPAPSVRRGRPCTPSSIRLLRCGNRAGNGIAGSLRPALGLLFPIADRWYGQPPRGRLLPLRPSLRFQRVIPD